MGENQELGGNNRMKRLLKIAGRVGSFVETKRSTSSFCNVI